MTYDWKKFTLRSDERYKVARANNNVLDLDRHNILKDGEIELRFIKDLTKAYFKNDLKVNTALDVACGIGYMSKCLADQGCEVTGFDLNSDAIAIAKSEYPEINFFISDATDLSNDITNRSFDLILSREVHCFSRVSDSSFHHNLVNTYLDMLNPGGIMVIAHSRIGADTKYPSINFLSLKSSLDPTKYLTAGPVFIFLYKHLKLYFPFRIVIIAQSFLSKLIALLTGKRWIEFFLILKK